MDQLPRDQLVLRPPCINVGVVGVVGAIMLLGSVGWLLQSPTMPIGTVAMAIVFGCVAAMIVVASCLVLLRERIELDDRGLVHTPPIGPPRMYTCRDVTAVSIGSSRSFLVRFVFRDVAQDFIVIELGTGTQVPFRRIHRARDWFDGRRSNALGQFALAVSTQCQAALHIQADP